MTFEWLFTWFENYSMKTNPDQFNLLLTNTNCQGIQVTN